MSLQQQSRSQPAGRHRLGGTGDAVVAARICDELGEDLSSLATTIMGNSEQAVELVAQVISTHARSEKVSHGSPSARRAELARDLYLRCLNSDGRVAQHQGKIAVALVRCGRLTYRDAAEVMHLPDHTVATMLRTTLVKHLS